MKVRYQIIFLLFLFGWISACQNSDSDNGVQPQIQLMNVSDNQLKSDPGTTFVIEAEISSEEELTGIYKTALDLAVEAIQTAAMARKGIISSIDLRAVDQCLSETERRGEL